MTTNGLPAPKGLLERLLHGSIVNRGLVILAVVILSLVGV